ncbi:peptidoglycan-binding protein [Tropicimonas sediminicola]|uniref:TPR repeat n=1 Tax=Tropicimonas sediminicola TaxID=1031541 RepID=A0A239FUE3_9RHOB|nr:peptidoglycan-binding protein [Tropicimonas sediminicola]SNS60627.1 hypothetical protein SAMN05421757_102844 [Tropicimonas sediminicola]
MPKFPTYLVAWLLICPMALPVAGQEPSDLATLQKDLSSAEAATRDAAEAELRVLAGEGNAEAAGLLSRAFDKSGDRQAAIDILGPAAAAGDIPTIQRLTWLLRETGAEAAEVRDALRLGWEAGDVASGISYARSLMEAGDPDSIGIARQTLEAASEQPDFTAWADLASMRKSGVGGAADPEGAFLATQEAANAGNAWSELHLARMLLNGEGTTADPARALTHFQTALQGEAELAATARRDLAAAHLYRKFGALSDPDTGLDLAAEGIAAGDIGMVRVAATMREEEGALGEKAETIRLQALDAASQAAAGGDEVAARSLFDYWHKLAVRSPDAARKEAEIVEAHGALLDRPRLVRHELLNQAQRVRGSAERAEAVALLETLDGKDYTAALLDLRSNQNLYVQAIQSRLAQRGFDPGVPDGLLGPRTLQSVAAFCKSYGVEEECENGPLSWQLGQVVGIHLDPADDPAEP